MEAMDDFLKTNNPDAHSILMHCRPRESFHLGNLYCMNHIKKLIEKRYFVTILIFPFEESISDNHFLIGRLQENVEITKKFIVNYLGNPHNLMVLSSQELELDSNTVSKCLEIWDSILSESSAEDDENLKSLVLDKSRKWAFQARFVAKCIAAICKLKPTHLVFGEKHVNIATSFNTIIRRLDEFSEPNLISIPDFLDYNGSPMDSMQGSNACIDIMDGRTTLDNKLMLLSGDHIYHWLKYCLDTLIKQSPSKHICKSLQEKIRSVNIKKEVDRGSYVEILDLYLQSVRADLHYMESYKEKEILCRSEIRSALHMNFSTFEQLIRELFYKRNANTLKVHKLFSNGKSGSLVLEVLISSKNSHEYINSAIVKLDRYDKIMDEFNNFNKYIEPNQTHAFVEVSKPTKSINGWGGLIYKDAKMWLGKGIGKNVESLRKVLSIPVDNQTMDQIIACIAELIDYQLFYTIYNQDYDKNEYVSLAKYYSQSLPSAYQISVDQFDKDTNTYIYSAFREGDQVFEDEMIISEIHDKFIRLYNLSYEVKADLYLEQTIKSHITTNKNAIIFVKGLVKKTQEKEYLEQLQTLGFSTYEDKLFDGQTYYYNVFSNLKALLNNELEYLCISPIHGDLHTENIMFQKGQMVVIDYGMVRPNHVTVHDTVLLLCDLIVNCFGKLFSQEETIGIVSTVFGLRMGNVSVTDQNKRYLKLLKTFCYASSKNSICRIKDFCSEKAYYTCICLQFLSLLKFESLTKNEKRLALICSSLFCEKVLTF